MENENSQNKLDRYTRRIFSALITLFGLIYLLLVLLGKVDKQSQRFQIPEVIIFTVVLLLNSESLQRLSKLQFGKEGVSFELNEIKQGQAEIKQNQEKIQEIQKKEQENIAELRGVCENFLDNNKSIIPMLKRLSEISITNKKSPEKSPSEVLEATSPKLEDTSKRTSSYFHALLELVKTNPDLLDYFSKEQPNAIASPIEPVVQNKQDCPKDRGH